MKYIVTGCNGQVGGRVAANMLEKVSGDQLIFTCSDISRVPDDKLRAWQDQGVSVRQANYDNKEEMAEAFKGGDRIYIVSSITIGENRIRQHKNAVDAAISAGIRHITYTSCIGASDPACAHFYVVPDHTVTEEYIRQKHDETGVKYNFMQNNLYLDSFLGMQVVVSIANGNKWYTNAGDGKATFIAKDDSARVAAALLLGMGEDGKSYEVCGGESVSPRGLCDIVNETGGLEIEYCPLTDEQYFEYFDAMHIPRLATGDFSNAPIHVCSTDIVSNERGIAEGFLDVSSNDVELLTGRKPITPRELAEGYKGMWSQGNFELPKEAAVNPSDSTAAPESLTGKYSVTVKTPGGPIEGIFDYEVNGETLVGAVTASGETTEITDGSVDGNGFSHSLKMKTPMGKMKVAVRGRCDGDGIAGEFKSAMMSMPFSGTRLNKQ